MNLDDVYTMLPGTVVSYDGAFAVVRLGMAKTLANGQSLAPPTVAAVPVKFPVADGGRARVTVPLKPGDPVECTFCCRSLENWLSGSDGAPDDPRRFDISDAFCTPVMRPPLKADTENLVVEYGSGGMRIAPNGAITFYGPGVTFEAPVTNQKPVETNALITMNAGMTSAAGGEANFQGPIKHQGKSIGIGHGHSGVQPGGGNTGGVV